MNNLKNFNTSNKNNLKNNDSNNLDNNSIESSIEWEDANKWVKISYRESIKKYLTEPTYFKIKDNNTQQVKNYLNPIYWLVDIIDKSLDKDYNWWIKNLHWKKIKIIFWKENKNLEMYLKEETKNIIIWNKVIVDEDTLEEKFNLIWTIFSNNKDNKINFSFIVKDKEWKPNFFYIRSKYKLNENWEKFINENYERVKEWYEIFQLNEKKEKKLFWCIRLEWLVNWNPILVPILEKVKKIETN